MAGEPTIFRAWVIAHFGEDYENARAAIVKVEHWKKAFKLHGQMVAWETQEGNQMQVIVELAFEEFERLAFERWLERIRREEPFTRATRVDVLRAKP